MPSAAADQDGHSGEGEDGETFRPVAADVRRLILKGLKARKKKARGKRSETPGKRVLLRPSGPVVSTSTATARYPLERAVIPSFHHAVDRPGIFPTQLASHLGALSVGSQSVKGED